MLSASHTSTVAEQLVSVVAAMQSLTHSRHVVSELITDQLDSITRLLSSPASLLLLASSSEHSLDAGCCCCCSHNETYSLADHRQQLPAAQVLAGETGAPPIQVKWIQVEEIWT